MAGVLSMFSLATATIHELKNSSKSENTVKSTAFWLSVWKKWCLEKRIVEEIENYEPAELNTLLEQFHAELKNKHGEDYEPASLKVMIASLDRHLKKKKDIAYIVAMASFGVLYLPRFGLDSSSPSPSPGVPGHPTSICNTGKFSKALETAMSTLVCKINLYVNA